MKYLVLAFALLLAAPSTHASALVRVTDPGFCARITDGFCHEWALEADSRLRIVFHGFEDGASYALYRKGAFGYYRHVLDFVPVLQVGDEDAQALEYLGDATDLEIATAPGRKVRLLASFELTWEQQRARSESHDLPGWQARVPALLFTRAAPLHAYPVARQTFVPVTLKILDKAVRVARPGCEPHGDLELVRKCP